MLLTLGPCPTVTKGSGVEQTSRLQSTSLPLSVSPAAPDTLSLALDPWTPARPPSQSWLRASPSHRGCDCKFKSQLCPLFSRDTQGATLGNSVRFPSPCHPAVCVCKVAVIGDGASWFPLCSRKPEAGDSSHASPSCYMALASPILSLGSGPSSLKKEGRVCWVRGKACAMATHTHTHTPIIYPP